MVNFCAMIDCSNRARRDKKSFYRLPAEITREGEHTLRLSRERRKRWLDVIARNIKATSLSNIRVCSDHFVSGKPSTLYDTGNPDWAPSLKLGYDQNDAQLAARSGKHKKKRKKRTAKNTNHEDHSKILKVESSGEFSLPPLFPSRVPMSDEDDEDEDLAHQSVSPVVSSRFPMNVREEDGKDEINPESEQRNADVSDPKSIESNTHLGSPQKHDLGPYCREAGISMADVALYFTSIPWLSSLKNGLVLEVYDYLTAIQKYEEKALIGALKRISGNTRLHDSTVGAFIKGLLDRRKRIVLENTNKEQKLRCLYEEEYLQMKKKMFTEQSLDEGQEVAREQIADTRQRVELEKELKFFKEENAALLDKITEISSENRDLRMTVGRLEERCQILEQKTICLSSVKFEEDC